MDRVPGDFIRESIEGVVVVPRAGEASFKNCGGGS